MSAAASGSPILRETRWLAAFIIPFLAIAFVILYFFPTETAQLFAWDIKPPMTAMMLAAAYAGGIWFFVRVLGASSWRNVHIGFPAIGIFASILGIATVAHWDRFIPGNPAFYAWFGLYFATPFLVFATWFRQQRLETGPRNPEAVLPRGAQVLFGGVGIAAVLLGVVLFLAPTVVAQVWPWTVTPLTARVVSAMFTLTGVVGIGMAIDPRWSACRIVSEALIVSIALILVAVWRDQSNIAIGSPAAWLFVLGLAGMMTIFVGLYVVMERRSTYPD